MFTGIVEEVGGVVAIDESGDGARLTVRGPRVVSDAAHGDSIAVNGCCLTVTDRDDETFTVDVMRESLDKTALGRLRPGNRVVVGRNRFKVTRVRRVTGMSREAVAALFSDRGKPRLVLITCGDRNNLTGVYHTRIIVNARKLPSR